MRIGGIASGFDTEQIVNQLMEVERIPLIASISKKFAPNGREMNIEHSIPKLPDFKS